MKLTCYILDDEMHAINVLKDYISKTPDLELIGYATEPLVALKDISSGSSPHITFVDVDMPEINGLTFADLIGPRTSVIFTTAYREYGADAFEKRAADFMVKPVFYERFLASVMKVRELHLLKAHRPQALSEDFFVKTGTKGKSERVVVSDIVYIQGADSYIIIHSKNNKIITYMTLSDVIRRLPGGHFTRIHKSYIIRDQLVQMIEPGQVTLPGGIVLPVGPSYKSDFQQKMGHS